MVHTELVKKVSHRKGRDSALRRLGSAPFPGNSFSNNPVQGDHGGSLDFVDFNLGVPPVCPLTVPSLPNFHQPKHD